MPLIHMVKKDSNDEDYFREIQLSFTDFTGRYVLKIINKQSITDSQKMGGRSFEIKFDSSEKLWDKVEKSVNKYERKKYKLCHI